jgi:hypothetical protein
MTDFLPIMYCASVAYLKLSYEIAFVTSRAYTPLVYLTLAAWIHAYVLYYYALLSSSLFYYGSLSMIGVLLGGVIGYVGVVFVFEMEPLLPNPFFGFNDVVKHPTLPIITLTALIANVIPMTIYYWCLTYGIAPYYSQVWGICALIVFDALITFTQYWFTLGLVRQEVLVHGAENLKLHTPFSKEEQVWKVFLFFGSIKQIFNLSLFMYMAPVIYPNMWGVIIGASVAMVIVIIVAFRTYNHFYRGTSVHPAFMNQKQ